MAGSCAPGQRQCRFARRPRSRPYRSDRPQGISSIDRQLLGILRERPPHADRPRRMAAPAGLPAALPGRSRHRLCVSWTADDATRLGYEVIVLEDACRGIGLPTGAGRTTIDDARASSPRAASASPLRGNRLGLERVKAGLGSRVPNCSGRHARGLGARRGFGSGSTCLAGANGMPTRPCRRPAKRLISKAEKLGT